MRAIIMHLADTPLCLIFSHSGPIKGEYPEGHWAFDRHISITESHISLSQFRKIYESQSAFDLHAMALAPILHAALSLYLWFSRSSFFICSGLALRILNM